MLGSVNRMKLAKHLFSQCSRLQSLFQVLQAFCMRLGFSVSLFIGGLWYTGEEEIVPLELFIWAGQVGNMEDTGE